LNVTLEDGRVIDASRVRGAVNRVLGPCPAFAGWEAAPDSGYMQAELHAFYLSWLKSLPGLLINRPAATGLCGPWLHASEWTLRAVRAGLKTRRYRHEARPGRSSAPPAAGSAASRQVIAFGGRVFGAAVPDELAAGCRRLADDAGTAVLGIDFHVDPSGHWLFADATPCPDLSLGGMPLLRRMAALMQETRP
jgi:hypothetical protein